MREWAPEIAARLQGMSMRPESEAELVEELSQHLDEYYRELQSQGVSEEDARARALSQIDAMDIRAAAREKSRPWRGTNEPLGGANAEGLLGVVSDLRFGARLLLRNRGLALAAIITLAVGIGANTAIFAAVNAVILRPLPFPHPEQLYKLWEENPEMGWHNQVAAPANYLDWKEGVSAFADMAAYTPPPGVGQGGMTLLDGGAPQLMRVSHVTGNFFDVMGAVPMQGRGFTTAETWEGTEPAIVLSANSWRTKFGAEPVLNRQIRLNGKSYRVIGIMPASFTFPEQPDAWVTSAWDPAAKGEIWFRRAHWLHVIGRLKPGASPDVAETQLQSVVERLKVAYPETNRVMGAGMTPLHEFIVGDTHAPLVILLSSVGLLLLIACANVGNLMLVKAAARQRELAIRRALGASAGRLVRQLLTEGLVLAAAGSTAGIAAGWAMTRALERLQPRGLLSETHFSIDATVVAYVIGVTIVAGLIFGAIPALSLKARAPGRTLADSNRSGAPGRGARSTANALVVAEVAIAVMLVVGGGLLTRTFIRLQSVDPGVDPKGVLAIATAITGPKYDSASQRLQYYTALEARAKSIPGVRAVGIATVAPLSGTSYTSQFAVAGRGREEYVPEIAHRSISAGYFDAMKVPLIAGRAFDETDRAGSPPVVIVNKAVADQHFRNQNPVGQRITFSKYPDSTSVWLTIVGVAGAEHQKGMSVPPMLEAFVPLSQEAPDFASILLRTDGDPLSLTPLVRAAIHDIDPELALQRVTTIEAIHAESLSRERFFMTVLLLFAAVALLLAVVGVYGVTAQSARQRRQEIGVRLALGARSADILRLVVRESAALIVLGVLAGSLIALIATRALTSLLFGVSAADPLTYISVAGVLLLTGLVASWVPARSASRGDPAAVLRVE
jgi:putative ABC transport system permease protein